MQLHVPLQKHPVDIDSGSRHLDAEGGPLWEDHQTRLLQRHRGSFLPISDNLQSATAPDWYFCRAACESTRVHADQVAGIRPRLVVYRQQPQRVEYHHEHVDPGEPVKEPGQPAQASLYALHACQRCSTRWSLRKQRPCAAIHVNNIGKLGDQFCDQAVRAAARLESHPKRGINAPAGARCAVFVIDITHDVGSVARVQGVRRTSIASCRVGGWQSCTS